MPGTIIGLLFALLLTYTQQQQGLEEKLYLLKMLPFILTIVVMIVFGRFIKGPKAAGTHFDKGLR